MLNSIVLVGRIVESPTLHSFGQGRFVTNIRLAVQRPFKNSSGEYDADFLTVSVWDVAAKNACEYCKKGDVVAVTGRIQSRKMEYQTLENDVKVTKNLNLMDIMGERVIYLSTSGRKENNDNFVDSAPAFDDLAHEDCE